MRRWRVERQRRAKGWARMLRSSAPERIGITLGVMSEEAAQRHREGLLDLEEAGRADAWLAWYRRDPTAAVAALVHQHPIAQVDRLSRDWGAMRLRRYFREEYAPWRSTQVRAWKQEERTWRRILDELGGIRLRQIDPWLVADYLDELTVRGGPRKGLPASGNTKRLHRAYLRALLKRAYRQRHLSELPDLAVFRIKGSAKRVRKQKPPLTVEEARFLLEAASEQHAAMFGLGLGMGLRPSEIVRVRWEDIDWEARTLRVRGTKTADAAATLPIPPLSWPWLRRWWAVSDRPETGHAFHGQGAWPYKTTNGWKRALQLTAKRAGLGRKITPYLLRHSFATLAWVQGIEKDVARRMLRHTDERMLDEVYARPRPTDLGAKLVGFDLELGDQAETDGAS